MAPRAAPNVAPKATPAQRDMPTGRLALGGLLLCTCIAGAFWALRSQDSSILAAFASASNTSNPAGRYDAEHESAKVPAADAGGVSLVIATHRRAEKLKLFLPHYLKVPIVREIVLCNDFDSSDDKDLAAWLPTSGIPAVDQARVRLVNDTGARLGAFRNKVRCLGLARYAWVAIIDSDNFASPEHYWAPLVSYWTSTYGAAPPPPGTRAAEMRAHCPSMWMQTKVLMGPTELVPPHNWSASFGRVCSSSGDAVVPELPVGAPMDGSAAVGRGCWAAVYNKFNAFCNMCNHIVHGPTFYPVYKGPADLAAADPANMEPFGSDCSWFSYISVAAGLLLYPVPGFYHDHLSGFAPGASSFFLETQGKAAEFCNRHKLDTIIDGPIGPRHPAP